VLLDDQSSTIAALPVDKHVASTPSCCGFCGPGVGEGSTGGDEAIVCLKPLLSPANVRKIVGEAWTAPKGEGGTE